MFGHASSSLLLFDNRSYSKFSLSWRLVCLSPWSVLPISRFYPSARHYCHYACNAQVSGSRLHSEEHLIQPQSLHRGSSETDKIAGVGGQERQAGGPGGQGGRDGDQSSASRNLFTR